jgi:1-acyl-sn-glycerol-3-phosphate acyltransferase
VCSRQSVMRPSLTRRLAAWSVRHTVMSLAYWVTHVQSRWIGCKPEAVQRIYYVNHASHADFLLVWTSLPAAIRATTRPVAAREYWDQNSLRRFLVGEAFNAVLIERDVGHWHEPIGLMEEAINDGSSLIIFPEGTRNTTDELLLPFKVGIYYLAARCPQVELVPVWIDNLKRVLPKGALIPVPLLCTVSFGSPIRLLPAESPQRFVDRARTALLELAYFGTESRREPSID